MPSSTSDSRTSATTLSGSDKRALAAIMMGVVLASLDAAIVNTALPAIAADLHTPPSTSVWVINAYQLAVVATLLPFAALGDRWGARRVFLGGLAFFVAASLACALARTLPQLAVARVLQGVGGAGLMSVNVALIRLIYPPQRLGRGVGLNALVVGLGFAMGPTVASLVLALGAWPWLFAINVPLGVLALAVGQRAIPHTPARAHHVEALTTVLTAITFAALIFALTGASQRFPWYTVLGALLLSLLSGLWLLRRQAGHPAPMLPVDLLRRPMFALSALTATCAFTVQGLALVSLPFYFEQVMHRNPVETGFLITPWAVVVALTAPLAGRLSDRHPPGLLGGCGLAVLCLGMLSFALMPMDAQAPGIVLRMAVCGIGFGFFQSPNLKALMSSAPPQRSGGASGIIGMARLIGQTSGAALVALCLGLAGAQGAGWALALGAGFAALASAVSFGRLRVH